MSIFLDFLDKMISVRLKSDLVSHSKARIIAGVTLLVSVILVLNAFRSFANGGLFYGILTTVVAVLMISAVVIILKKFSSYLIAGNSVLILYWTVMIIVIGSTQGVGSPIIHALTPFVFTAFLLAGLRSGLFWGAMTIVAITGMKILEMNGYPFLPVAPCKVYFSAYYTNAMANLVNAIIMGSIFAYSSTSNLVKAGELQRKTEKTAEEQQVLLVETNKVMNDVAGGDLTKRIGVDLPGKLGLLRSSVNDALIMLGKTMLKVDDAGKEIILGSKQMSESSQALASGTTEQAASIEEISSSITEIANMAKASNENAAQARNMSAHNAIELGKANQQMEQMLNSMESINKSSSNVSRIIRVIDEIAFQTNLLALNAAVEAARAGKYGKGFAVVAEEVRNLAARSAEAVKDTTELIETSIKEVEKGVQNADQTAEILKEFVINTEKVNDLVGEISSASQEQVNAVNEINTGMNQVNQVIQRNSSISEENSSASQELASRAKSLRELMCSFKLRSETDLKWVKTADHKHVSARINPHSNTALVGTPGRAMNKEIVLDEGNFGKC